MIECPFEADTLFAAMHEKWDPTLREHVATCPVCSDVSVVAGALHREAELPQPSELPDSGRIWWMSQLRARREAARTAGRPITAIQVLAFSAAMGLLGACFGATSQWFQATVRWAGALQLPWSTVALLGGLAALVLVIAFAIVASIGLE